MRVFLILLLCVAYSTSEDALKVTAGDSYLDAYKEAIGSKVVQKAEKKSDQGYPVYPGPNTQESFENPQYGPPGPQYGPPTPQYGPPAPQYGPPVPQYGSPAPQYGSPGPQYGAPAPQFGPPATPPSYGSFGEPAPQYGPPIYGPPAQNLQVFYGMPHAMVSIWDKLWEKAKWKLSLFTIGKILLKLVIFKKIVSLIAILCLLLFIPSLKKKKFGLFHGDDEGERSLNMEATADNRLNTLSAFALEAIENYKNTENKKPPSCNTTYCRTKKLVRQLDKKISDKRLVKLYVSESN